MVHNLKVDEDLLKHAVEGGKIYVFDMGKVITKPARISEMYLKANMKCTAEEFKTFFYQSSEADLSYKGILSDDEFFDFIRKSCGSDKTSKQLQELYALSKGGIYDEVMLEIERLKKEGNPVCLLSNLREVDYKCLSEKINLGLFDQLFLSYKLGMCKPHKDIFEYVINELGTNDFYFFDDSLKNINMAQSLGIHAYQTTGEELPKCIKKIR